MTKFIVKRFLPMLLVAVLLLCAAVACAETVDDNALMKTLITPEEFAAKVNGTKIQKLTDEPVTFTVWLDVGGNGALGKLIDKLEDMDLVKTMAEKTGVSLEFKPAPIGQQETSFSLMAISGDWTDIIIGFDTMYADGPDAAIEEGIIYELTDLIEKNMPNYSKARKESEFRTLGTLTDAGNQPYICNFSYKDFLGLRAGGLIIRKDLLNKLGMEMPVTLDDLHTFLSRCHDELGMTRAFGMNYNGINKYNALNASFDHGANTNTGGEIVFQVDGKIQYAPLTEGYREYLTTMAQWYQEGLIDPDFTSTLTFDDGIALMTSNQCAVLGENMYVIDYVNGLGKAVDPDFEFVVCPSPVRNVGDQLHISCPDGNNVQKTCAISTKCKNVDLLLQYIDQYYTDEGFLLCNFGTEGKTYHVEDGLPKFEDIILNNPNGTKTDTLSAYTAPVTWFYEGVVCRDADYIMLDRAAVYTSNSDNEWQLPPINLNSDEKAIYSELWGDISSYVDEMTVKFIMGLEPMDNYDTFVTRLKEEFRVEELIAAYQSALDRYYAR